MNQLRLSLIIVSAFCTCTGCQTTSLSVEDECTAENFRALTAFRNSKYADAEGLYAGAVTKAESSKNQLQLPLILQEQSDVYVKESKLPQAEACLLRAFDIYSALKTKAVASPERTVVLEGQVKTLERLADVLVLEGKMSDAEIKFKSALELNRSFGGAVESTVRISSKYAALLKKLQKVEQAEDVQNQVDATTLSQPDVNALLTREMQDFSKHIDHARDIAKFKSLVDGAKRFNRPDLGRQANCYLGLSYLSVNRLNEAVAAFDEGLHCARITSNYYNKQVENDAVSGSVAELACGKLLQGKTSESNKLFAEAKRTEWLASCRHINLILATLCVSQQFAMAEIICNQLIEFTKPDQGMTPRTEAELSGMLQIADSYQQHQKFAEAERWYIRCLALLEKNKASSAKFAEIWERLGIALAGREKFVESNSYLLRSVPEIIKARGYETMETANIECRIGNSYSALKQWDNAVKHYQQACGIYQKVKPGSMEFVQAIRSLAETEENLGHFSVAIPLRKHALAILERVKGPSSFPVAGALGALAHDHAMLKHYPMAERLFKDSIDMFDNSGDKQTKLFALSLEHYADCYMSEGKEKEAEPLFERSLAMWKAINDKSSPEAIARINATLQRKFSKKP